MTHIAGSVLVESINEQQHMDGMSGVRPDTAISLLNTVADMLDQGSVPQAHPARLCARQLREYASSLKV
jgi:hypothetical protein